MSTTINWTKGIDQKTGKPVDYDPDQGHPDLFGRQQTMTLADRTKKLCPSHGRRQQLLAGVLQPEDQAALHPGASTVQRGRRSTRQLQQRNGATGTAAPFKHTERNEIRHHRRRSAHRRDQEARCTCPIRTTAARSRPPAASSSPASPTAPFAAYDDTTLDQLWKINVGAGFNAPPMTFEVGGKQYVAILSGLSRDRQSASSSTRRNCGTCATRPCCSCSGCEDSLARITGPPLVRT